eukprot:12169082-Alexandrium_andersonii.AAC.1
MPVAALPAPILAPPCCSCCSAASSRAAPKILGLARKAALGSLKCPNNYPRQLRAVSSGLK